MIDAARRHGRARAVRPVVDAVDVSVADGEWLALIGPNGAGKTTLLRAIARLLPFTGEIVLDGRRVGELSRSELSRLVAVVPQEPSTPPWMTVAEYVAPRPDAAPRAARRRRAPATATRRRERSRGSTSSRSRIVAWGRSREARSSVSSSRARSRRRRSIVLLDEPTAALDIGHQQQALELLDGLRARVRADARRGDARPDAGGAVRGPDGAARPGQGRRRRRAHGRS